LSIITHLLAYSLGLLTAFGTVYFAYKMRPQPEPRRRTYKKRQPAPPAPPGNNSPETS
jgi:hypothetical protein